MQSAWDFFSWRILDDWLVRYLSFRTGMPEVIAQMRSRPEEFELIPVPRELVEQLGVEREAFEAREALMPPGAGLKPKGAASLTPGIFDPVMFARQFTVPGSSMVETVGAHEKAKHAEELVRVVRDLVRGVERGDVPAVLGVVAEDYHDLTGRTKAAFGESMQSLVAATSERRVILTRVEQLEMVGSRMVGVVSGVWQANLREGDRERTQTEAFKMELIFAQEPGTGRWKITSARYV